MPGTQREDTAPLVAIIIPVYNDAEYLHQCLDSVKNQTAPFWEAWVVDDCSTDQSASLIREYCAADSRFRFLQNEVNSSAWVSRARGILSVSPSVKYIMFADADDSLRLDAVERAYQLMEQDPVDILHFGTNVENIANISRKKIQGYTNYLQPECAKLKGREVFESFVTRKFEGHLWNKMFCKELLQAVIQELGADRVLPKAQDKALYWAVCWQKEDLTYRGVADRLYNYNYGLGVEGGQSHITLQQYRQYLAQAWTEDTIAEVMAKHPQEAAEYAEVLEDSRSNLMNHTARAYTRLQPSDAAAGMDLVGEYWRDPLDKARFAGALAAHTWGSQRELAETIMQSKLFATSPKEGGIKVVGTYYHRMDNGGIQRVIAQLLPIWHELGYEVVLFTDYEPDENDYDIPDYVKRAVIGASFSRSRRGKYAKRGRSFTKLLSEYQVDCMVYHAYFSDVLLYDMCVCKGLNIPFLIYEHNVFSRFARYSDTKFATIPVYTQLAEGLICLDDVSAIWWKNFNGNVHTVLNPLTFSLSETLPARRDNHNILFLCRLEEESKHPHDAITIIRDLVPLLPDVKLYMVGSGDERYMDSLRARIAKLNLQDNIVMTGFTKNVEEYYRQCSVFLSCSSHEGAPMTLCEALSFGLPVVMYDLSYLQVAQNNPGIFMAKQRDTSTAVNILYDLLTDHARLLEAGDAGRRYLEDLYSVDLGRQWRGIFHTIHTVRNAVPPGTKRMCDILVRDYYDGALQAEAWKKDQKELREIRKSLSFRLGRAITFIPRKIRDKLKKVLPPKVKSALKKLIKSI